MFQKIRKEIFRTIFNCNNIMNSLAKTELKLSTFGT
jgi:hypothetical protein